MFCPLALVLALALVALPSNALRFEFQVRQRPSVLLDCSSSSCGQLGDIQDSIYVSSITVGGQQYEVLLDTGSSDLWVNASLLPPKADILQDVVVSELYGDGSNYTGPVAFAEVEFHGFTIANQSFTYALQSENDNTGPLNVTGLIGLSFNGQSNIQEAVQQATGSAAAGQTFLSNVFAANTSLPNYISFFLSREADVNASANAGAFTISEIEQGYDAINSQSPVALFPANNVEWTIPLDSLLVNNAAISLPPSVVSSSSSVKSVVLLDTGTSSILLPPDIVTTYYQGISGAQPIPAPGGSSSQWTLPCDVEPPSLAFVIGGQTLPIHPLDINTVAQVFETSSGSTVSFCTGGLVGSDAIRDRFDILLGSPFLRNSYTLFNFGSNSTTTTTTSSSSTTGPFVKLLSITNPSTASSDFAATRKAQLASAPAASSQQIAQILNGSPSFTPVDPSPLSPTGSSTGSSPSATGKGKSGALSLRVGGGIGMISFVMLAWLL